MCMPAQMPPPPSPQPHILCCAFASHVTSTTISYAVFMQWAATDSICCVNKLTGWILCPHPKKKSVAVRQLSQHASWWYALLWPPTGLEINRANVCTLLCSRREMEKKNPPRHTSVCSVHTERRNAYIWLMAVVVIQRISVRAAHGCYIVMNTPHSRRCL